MSRLLETLKEIFTLRLALQMHQTPYPGLADDLAALLPADFVQATPFERLKHLPRYLKAMQLRAERWKRDAAKDATRAAELALFVAAVRKHGARAGELRWAVEEFRVSVFAQELGTAESVSAVRLERMLTELGGALAEAKAIKSATVAPAPVGAAAKPAEKTVFKSLGALANLRLPK